MPNKLAKKAYAGGSAKLHLKWVRSAICSPVQQKLVVKGLGFTRLNQVIERPDNPAIRGMVAKVPHLVEIVQS
jgi:large subunit ribosomal protein L30